ncbi:FAD-binding oxidoreductase [Phormidium yuhuli AB48]|uniref:FAD-binding oxidoreductase n=1 Tax=Phormidium yuhuli AB48 TaxID=2940671 RepID=A0ABY5AQE5_9CYAN|nr:FAD-binding oxidoreductase [Phormidium yuhuli]USR91030.1 FAD-binding oxidoreductase [Phormidium yuhuli AB48]
MSQSQDLLTQIPGNPWRGLQNADRRWSQLRQTPPPSPQVVEESPQPLGECEWDVVICGATLGILLGASLAQRGWRVAILERGVLKGRDQEWNISRSELQTFVELELLTPEELQTAIASEYNPARVAFPGSPEIWVQDILNIGVDPVYLLDILKQKFLAAGGTLLEQISFQRAEIHPDGVRVTTDGQVLTTRLLLDAMGHFSPIIQQIRGPQRPDSVCLVVGTCAQGYPKNETGDLFVSFTPILNQCQYFWEAFPARDGRTTYLFTYLDTHPDRFSLEFFFDEYLRLLPEYQQCQLDQLDIKRALFGMFPSYRNSPVRSPFPRLLPIGDSSGSQSPLSFGGFGAMVRHLQRLTAGISEALTADCLDRPSLALLQPYQPNLSVTWLFQQTMTVGANDRVSDDQAINRLLGDVFQAMEGAGDEVLRPFLQDVVQFGSLSQALFRTSISSPLTVAKVVPQVGIPPLLNWLRHYLALGGYQALSPLGRAIAQWSRESDNPQQGYQLRRWADAWYYGSGNDYEEKSRF